MMDEISVKVKLSNYVSIAIDYDKTYSGDDDITITVSGNGIEHTRILEGGSLEDVSKLASALECILRNVSK